jgi:hypothetical protein
MHAACPFPSWYQPRAQASQNGPLAGSAFFCTVATNLPATQFLQSLNTVVVSLVNVYLPAPQVTHAVAPASEYRPSPVSQGVHAAASSAAETSTVA